MPRKKRDEIVDGKFGVDIEELKNRMRDDFFFFCSFCFPHYITIPFARFHYDMHQILESDNEKVAIIIPRGHGKTTFAFMEIVYRILFRDNHYFVVIGNSVDKAKQNYILPLITEFENNSVIKLIFGDVIGDIWGMDRLEFRIKDAKGNIQNKMVKPFGVGQSIRGTKYLQYRPDFVLSDDIEDDEQVKNDMRREEIKNYFYEQVYPAIDKQGDIYSETSFACKPKLLVLGTILHYDSFLINLERLNGKGWSVLKKSCIENEDGKRKSLWDTRYSVEFWDKKYDEYKMEGRERSFRQEYYNEILSEDDREIATSNIRYYDLKDLDDIIKNTEKYIAIDLALMSENNPKIKTGMNNYDYNVVLVTGIDRDTGNIYILDMERFRTSDVNETINNAFNKAVKWLPKKIFYERSGMQKWFETLFRNKMNEKGILFKVEAISHGSRKKEERIRATVKIIVDQKKLFIPNNEIGRLFFEEAYQFPLGKHDDIIDTLAYAIMGSNIRILQNKTAGNMIKNTINETKERFMTFLDALDKKDENDNDFIFFKP